MNDDIMDIFEEFVEDYIPEEKQEEIPDPEVQAAEEAAKRETEENDSEREAWIKRSKEKRDAAFANIKAESEKVFKKRTELIDYLTVQAYFDRYPVRNCLLITAQLPGATRLKPFDEWKDEGRHIKKGAKAITLLEPGEEYTRRDGTVGRYYNTRALFDISQVTGGKYISSAHDGDVKEKLKWLFKTAKALDLNPRSYGEDGGRAAFYQQTKDAIYINTSVGFEIVYPQLCVELAHAVIANGHKDYTRRQYGSICEMAGYIMCVRNNVSVSEDAIPLRIAPGYEELKEKEVIKILEEVRSAANTLSLTIHTLKEGEMRERQKTEIHQPQSKGL